MKKIVDILYEHDCHYVSTKFSWNKNLSTFLYCEYLFSFYLDLRFSSFFLQQYLKFLKYLASGGLHFYFVTHHKVYGQDYLNQMSNKLLLNANTVTLKQGNWFPGTLTNWKFSKDLKSKQFLSKSGELNFQSFPSVVVIFDTPKDNYALSEVLKIDAVSCVFADSSFKLGSNFIEVIPLTVNFSYKKVIQFLYDLSIESIIEGDISLFRSFCRSKYKCK
uniref:30S ribosomal protein S2 n=1 Tax=Leucocryptos marina TaxID=299206 RepID=A0A679EJU5_LEUMA|nr:30S ribosomal protein S2 [Leucocryptos marina]BBQ05387.1 30S ribosomal protein S2 [Leucocryptos marina]